MERPNEATLGIWPPQFMQGPSGKPLPRTLGEKLRGLPALPRSGPSRSDAVTCPCRCGRRESDPLHSAAFEFGGVLAQPVAQHADSHPPDTASPALREVVLSHSGWAEMTAPATRKDSVVPLRGGLNWSGGGQPDTGR